VIEASPGKDRRLRIAFFQRDAAAVARDLIGAVLVRQTGGRTYRARIVETEAYVGPHDLACHASKGRTARTEVMFGPGGRAYIYFIYGMYDMFNVVTGLKGDAQAVLIRAAEPLEGWPPPMPNLSGPGKLTRAMKITRAFNGVPLTGKELHLEMGASRAGPLRILTTPRIGVDYARHWKDQPLRFIDADSRAVSGPR
jgi:DNA-3-methyladenine glycosylase